LHDFVDARRRPRRAMSDDIVTTKFMDRHLRIGIDSLTELINNGLTVKHLRF
jgi:AMP nucleosidase